MCQDPHCATLDNSTLHNSFPHLQNEKYIKIRCWKPFVPLFLWECPSSQLLRSFPKNSWAAIIYAFISLNLYSFISLYLPFSYIVTWNYFIYLLNQLPPALSPPSTVMLVPWTLCSSGHVHTLYPQHLHDAWYIANAQKIFLNRWMNY